MTVRDLVFIPILLVFLLGAWAGFEMSARDGKPSPCRADAGIKWGE